MLKETLLRLLKLLSVLCVYTLGFAAFSGLLSLLVFYVLSSGLPESECRIHIISCVAIVLVLSLPFLMRAICGFTSGENSFKGLLIGSLKPGRRLYLKFLVIGAAVYGLSYLIRLLPVILDLPALQILLTVAIFVCSLPVSFGIYKRDASFLAPESAKNRGVLPLPDMKVS